MYKMQIFFAAFLSLILFAGCTGPSGDGAAPPDSGQGMSLEERAFEAAAHSSCLDYGNLTNVSYLNTGTNTYWIDMDTVREGCSPACVVHLDNMSAEVNWRCTGLIPGTGDAAPEAFEPVYLAYVLDSPLMGQGWNGVEVTYYFEKESECGGKPAYLGVAKTYNGDSGQLYWMKTTLYTDNFSLAVSDNLDTAALAFDDAVSRRVQLNIPFFLHDIMLQGGVDAPDEWKEGDVLIARDVLLFTSELYDVSIAYVGEGEVSGIMCSNFSLALKSKMNNPVPIEVCEAEIGGMPVTLYFSLDTGEEGQMRWYLEEYGHSSSGKPVYHQCLDVVACPPVPDTSSEEAECLSSDGAMYVLMDRDNCYAGAACLSREGTYAHVSDESGNSVADIEVCAWAGEEPDAPEECIYTDGDGLAYFQGFEAENYMLSFNALTFPPGYLYESNMFSCTSPGSGPFVCEVWVHSR